MIQIKNATVIKSGEVLFKNLELELETGNHYIITGPNGGGKSTLLELIAGHIHASSGDVQYDFIEGNNWEERYWDKKQKLHLISTHAIEKLIPSTTDIYYQQRYYKEDHESVTVKDILGEVTHKLDEMNFPPSFHIESLLKVEINRLSNGQLKKVLLLKTLLMQKPKVLLLDYPFEGLDMLSRKELCNFIDFIAAEYDIQIILADHHQQLPAVINKRIDIVNFAVHHTDMKIPIEQRLDKQSNTVTPGSPVVEIKNLRIQYGSSVILENFNWTINQGERWALLGKNGSGKTTVFSLIFADHPMAYREEIYLFGKRRGTGESIWDIKKRITYLGPELISYLNPKSIPSTVRHYILAQKTSSNKEKLNELIKYFNCTDYIDKPVKNLSSGQLQIMMILISFMEEKELLLLDEPFQFLDDEQKKLLSQYLQEHLHAKTTLVLITHYEQDIKTWTNRRKQI